MIPNDVVERVRLEADSVSIIGEFVKLKRSGSSFRGPCPFHNGKDANFSIMPSGRYHCFVCGEKGDVFTFIQKRLGLDFVESVKWVGARSGVEVRDVRRTEAVADPREPLWEVNATTAEYFHERLWDSAATDAAEARQYLASRGMSREAADRFGIGYAPRDPAAMRGYLTGLGFDDARQLAAGVLIQTEEKPQPRPRFRHRLIFPITDLAGRVVGFGGRALGEATPKYLNSAESDVFAKRDLLYGLHAARSAIRRSERVFVVEGYFDAIRLALAGIEEVVAPLGTAMTEAQAALIHKYAKTAYLLYDSDRAGLKATFRAGDVLLAMGVSVQVVSLPPGEDPDTFTAKAGREGIERAVENSVDVFDRKIQILERSGYFTDLRKKREALDKLLPTIRATADRLTRDLYITRTGAVAGVTRDMLEQELATPVERVASRPSISAADRVVARGSSAPRARATPNDRRKAPTRRRGESAERELVRAMLHQRRFVESVAERVSPESFATPTFGQIFAALVREGPDATPEELARLLDQSAVEALHELLEEPGGLDRADQTVEGSVNEFRARDVDARLAQIDRELRDAGVAGQDALIEEKQRLGAELHGLGRQRWKQFNAPPQ